MAFKKKYSVIYTTVVIIFMLLLYSCDKKIPKLSKKRDRTIIEKYLELGYKNNENSNFDSSYYYFNKAKYTAEVQRDTSIIIHSLAFMTQVQSRETTLEVKLLS